MSLIFLGLGSNLGEKEKNLQDAVMMLKMEMGNLLSLSSFYISKPFGFSSENDFLNAVVLMETRFSPYEILDKTQEIEQAMGRTFKSNGQHYADRIIDIDILLYDHLVIDQPSLKIPHPAIVERDFVFLPLLEIAPNLIDPQTGKKFSELIAARNSANEIKKFVIGKWEEKFR
ncbi:2-amino-4-hydroxy-6-hydroxymethyldihydropteridine diphosphokinase [Porphyromonadaceae sp. NP-X]|nr:2-amino-4-hydroxy-6-hydroxymethyldihydropteridine diphosphokinase [Porphyromonadaceae sp. NP-X]